jgi:hypothetical protein
LMACSVANDIWINPLVFVFVSVLFSINLLLALPAFWLIAHYFYSFG